MSNPPSSLLLPGQLRSGFIVPVRVPALDQVELFNHLLRNILISYLKPYSCMRIIHYTMEYLINKITNVKQQYLETI